MTSEDRQNGGAVLVTGANGHLGTRLVNRLSATRQVIAAVRSPGAAQHLTEYLTGQGGNLDRVQIEVISYTDVAALNTLIADCSAIVHLVGIIKESPTGSYFDAHEATTQALLDALAVGSSNRDPDQTVSLCYLSIVGAHPTSSNACLASKGRAEQMLLDSGYSTAVLQLPMVLGEGDYAAQAINQQAAKGLNFVFAKNARDQPIYAGDVLSAIIALLPTTAEPAASSDSAANARIVLAGPESVTKAQLITRAAAFSGRSSVVIGLPLFFAQAFTQLISRVSSNPPITPAMLEILHHDDNFDVAGTCDQLGLTLTGLDEMLAKVATAQRAP